MSTHQPHAGCASSNNGSQHSSQLSERGSSALRQTVTIGPHQLLADEAKDVGSNDEGPDPYEYLLAALGTCTNMTLRMCADRKRWPLREVTDRIGSREKLRSRLRALRTAWRDGRSH